jgi:hypothetical protein
LRDGALQAHQENTETDAPACTRRRQAFALIPVRQQDRDEERYAPVYIRGHQAITLVRVRIRLGSVVVEMFSGLVGRSRP